MIRTIRNILLLIFVIVASFTSCEQQQEEPCILSDYENALIEASYWIDSNLKPEINFGDTNQKGKTIKIIPDWTNIIFNRFEGFTTIELNLKRKVNFGFVTNDCRKTYDKTFDSRYLQSLTRLVIKVDRFENTTQGFFMTIIPSADFRKQSDFKCFKSTYLKIQEDFSGYILFHNIDGSFSNGWYYSNGELLKTVKSNHSLNIIKDNETKSCVYHYLTIWNQDCVYWWSESGGNITLVSADCGPWYPTYEFLYEECTYEGGDSEGGGEGGYDPPAEISSTPSINLSQEFIDNEKLYCVYSNLVNLGTHDYNPYVLNFLANFGELMGSFNPNPGDIYFDVEVVSGYGESRLDYINDYYTIIINPLTVIYRSPIEIARTLMHEILHATIAHNYNRVPGTFTDDFVDHIENLYNVTSTDPHDIMINYYLQPMTDFLRDYDNLINNNIAPYDYYENLAYATFAHSLGLIPNDWEPESVALEYFRSLGLDCNLLQ